MPGDVQALFVLVAGLMPGAMYVWGFERVVGRWGINLTDRVLRFIGWSAVFHRLTWPVWPTLTPAYLVWWRNGGLPDAHLWLAPFAALAIPFAVGASAGRGVRSASRWVRFMAGAEPAPRAWEAMFFRPRTHLVWVRLRLKSGAWVGGVLGRNDHTGRDSYAAGYGEEQDLLISTVVPLDEHGQFVLDVSAAAANRTSLLIRWAEVEFMEVVEPGSDT